MAMLSAIDVVIVGLGLLASAGWALNYEIDTRMKPPETSQAYLQTAGFAGGFLFALALHSRHSGSWTSPLKLLLLSAVFWCASENLDLASGGLIFGEHPWDIERMQVPLLGSMPVQQPFALQVHVFLSLHFADIVLALPTSTQSWRPGCFECSWGAAALKALPRAALAAAFATALDAAAEPAWLSLRLYSYSACQGQDGYCILGVDPKNYVAWFAVMGSCYVCFHFWDGLPTARSAGAPPTTPRLLTAAPFLAWAAQLVWYANLIRHAGGGIGLQLNSLLVGALPLLVAGCCAAAGSARQKSA
mmetsp:Transcript_134815/g.430838  ORF Transcript_134815/g.430838 Transcript_134815/m.430838 type:complete len:303 (+) Transcript_134815:82-990(+)